MDERKFMLYFMGPLIALTIVSLFVCTLTIKKAYEYQDKYYSQAKEKI